MSAELSCILCKTLVFCTAGICNLCNGAVRFIAKRDPHKQLTFCSVQSPKAEPYLKG
jgi:predicted DCC family thiol-disulfide oxidoreductase YuxK